MADVTLSLDAERWNDEIMLTGTSAAGATGADSADTWTLPQTIGEVAIMEIILRAQNPATLVANPELLGAAGDVLSPAGSKIVDILGVQRWSRISVNQLATYFSPDPLVLFRPGEKIRFSVAELDTNGAPTGTFLINVKAVRVRPQVVQTSETLQLVR